MPDESKSDLFELASKHWPDRTWTDAERQLLRVVGQGETVDYQTGSEEEDDPKNADQWGDERHLPAELLAWLCSDRGAAQLVPRYGLRVRGALIEGAMNLDFCTVSFPISLSKCALPKGLSLINSSLLALQMPGSHVAGISADGMEIKGSLFLRYGFRSQGEVRLLGATIGGTLSCNGGHFFNGNGKAISADGMKVKLAVFLQHGFQANGEVRLLGATIGGPLSCIGGQFSNSAGNAINAYGMQVKGGVFLRHDFQVQGTVCLDGATIGGMLACDGAFETAKFDLESARIGKLVFGDEGWPQPGNLTLVNLTYDEVAIGSDGDVRRAIEWLQLQPEKPFHPQPYQQLANTLQKSGREAGAKEVLIAKNKDRLQHADMTKASRCWLWILGITLAYGYRPQRMLWAMIAFVLVGCVLFSIGKRDGLIKEVKNGRDASGGGFQALVYSIDAFVPLVNLHQSDHWRPNVNEGRVLSVSPNGKFTTGGALLAYLWIHIIAGWTLSTFLAIGMTGLVRR